MGIRESFEEANDVNVPAFAGVRLAYIKTMGVEDAMALGIVPAGVELPQDMKLYVIHDAVGRPIAIMDNWASAYGAALQNDLVPLSVH